jgi:hypothetical protein
MTGPRRPTHPAHGFDLIIGFDSEYVRNNARDIEVEHDVGNNVVCYSAAVRNPRTGARGSFVISIDGGRKSRRALSSIIGEALVRAEDGGLIDTPDGRVRALKNDGRDSIKIALVAHFSRADLPGLKDFNALKKRFDGLRGTFCTMSRPCVLDVRLPGRGRQRRVSVTLYDTKLLAPAGFGALEKLGAALGSKKLSVPAVIDESGASVPGITRMDLVRERHPTEFDAYARRDAEIAVDYWLAVAGYCQSVGVNKVPATLGSIGVEFVKRHCGADLAPVLGRGFNQNGAMSADSLPELAAIQTLLADAFHGGRNECYGVGNYGPRDTGQAPFTDIDLAGAYPTAMAHYRAIAWDRLENTTDLNRLATLEDMTFAAIEFQFDESTRYPSLPVDAGEYGLVFPLQGSTVVTGPELVVARNQGARIIVRAGVRLPFADTDGERLFANTAQEFNRQRAAAKAEAGGKKGSLKELIAKETANSVYGKTAQAVAGMKSQPVDRRLFNTRQGEYESMGGSALTAPHIAAYTSALPRAVMSEILANAPDDAVALSVTTDGVLSSMTLEAAARAIAGPVCRHFMSLRALVAPDGSSDILEVKHAARSVLSVKTRGNFTVEPAEIAPGKMSDLLCARAGHRLETPAESKGDEVAQWIKIHSARTFDTKLKGCVFASLQVQWEGNADLVDIEREVRANFDFDLKRRPINVRDGADSLIKFETVPWESHAEMRAWRKDFDAWRVATRSCLRTASDWLRFCAWRTDHRTRSAGQRTPWQQYLLVLVATGGVVPLAARGRRRTTTTAMSQADLADLLTRAGVPKVTLDIIRKVADREADRADRAPPSMLAEDFLVLQKLRELAPTGDFSRLDNGSVQVRSGLFNVQIGHGTTGLDNMLKLNSDTPATMVEKLNRPKWLEGTVRLADLNPPENAPLPEVLDSTQNPGPSTLDQAPQTVTDAHTTDAPRAEVIELRPVVRGSSPGATDARRYSPATDMILADLVPEVEARLRRQGVTSRHIRLGRDAAHTDGTAETDRPMATLVHALALKDGLPVELALVLVERIIAAMRAPMGRAMSQ